MVTQRWFFNKDKDFGLFFSWIVLFGVFKYGIIGWMSSQEEVIGLFQRILRDQGSRTLVFYVEIGQDWDDDYQFEVAMRLLPFQQQVKIMHKKFTADAKTALANQLLQRFISCLCLNTTDQSKLQFKQNQYGKPYLVDSDFSFSMSNQQGYTSMVISLLNKDIGIDLASCSDVDKFGEDYLRHFKDIFHPDEYQNLSQIKDNDDSRLVFTEYWALKESYTKKLGVGLNGDLASYNFTNVAKLQPTTYQTNLPDDQLQTQHHVQWENSTKLSITNQIENIDISLVMIPNSDIVISICGEIPEDPVLIKVPITLMTKFLS